MISFTFAGSVPLLTTSTLKVYESPGFLNVTVNLTFKSSVWSDGVCSLSASSIYAALVTVTSLLDAVALATFSKWTSHVCFSTLAVPVILSVALKYA